MTGCSFKLRYLQKESRAGKIRERLDKIRKEHEVATIKYLKESNENEENDPYYLEMLQMVDQEKSLKEKFI